MWVQESLRQPAVAYSSRGTSALTSLVNMKLGVFCFAALSAAASQVSGTQTQGCMSPQPFLAGQTRTGSIMSGGRSRSFIIDFPQQFGSAAMQGGAPLIVGFHGATRDPQYFKTMSQYSNSQFNNDHVVVYPAGVNNYWQGSPYASPGVDDIQFTNDLLNYLSRQYCLDTSRFYASGHSNGGGFSNTIACWPGISGRFSAYALYSAAIYAGSQGPNGVCTPDRAMTPIIEMHGHADPVIPYNGGTVAGGRSSTPYILTYLRNWVMRNGCSSSTLVSNVPFPGKVTRYDSECAHIRHFAFQNLPHAWPSNSSYIPTGDFKTPISGTLTAMAWFRTYA